MNTFNERGIALILALMLMSVLSVLGASLMFLAQTETASSMNYRTMSQARYAAEAGVQKATNFLLDPTQYAAPTAADLLGPGCVRTTSPVTCGGQEVILSATTAKASNYPVPAVQAAYNAAGQGTMVSGNLSLTFGTYARLLALQSFEAYGGAPGVTETWEVVANGSLTGSPKATVQVLAMLETPKVPASSYGAFGTDIMCGALTFGGNVTVNSYDSGRLSGTTAPSVANGLTSAGGDVGTNGNLTINGSVDVGGQLYTPRTGIGACTNGANGAIDGLTEGGSATVEGGMVKLPAAISYPTPILPTYSGLADVSLSGGGTSTTTCGALGLTPGTSVEVAAGTKQCNVTGDTITINGSGLVLPSISLSSSVSLVLTARSPAAQYNVNSITLTGQATIGIAATSATQGAILGVIGQDATGAAIATPVKLTGGSQTAITGCAACSNYDASMLQLIYAGTGEIDLKGDTNAVMTIYAPNSTVQLTGNGDLYGSILAKRMAQTNGSTNIHYDRRLLHDFWVAGHPLVGTFSWQRY